MIIDPTELTAAAAYKLLIGTIVPRPIAWVSTRSETGVRNIAPISFFTAVGRRPPMISITLQPRADGKTLKDTLLNIKSTGEFVVNSATVDNSDAVHRSAIEFDSNEDEFTVLDLEEAPCDTISAPRIAASPISYECIVNRIIPVNGEDNVVWGEVTRFHVRDDLYLDRGRIDTAALSPLGRLAAEYTLVDNVFTTPLSPETLQSARGARMRRLDGQEPDYSPINTSSWSPSGSTTHPTTSESN